MMLEEAIASMDLPEMEPVALAMTPTMAQLVSNVTARFVRTILPEMAIASFLVLTVTMEPVVHLARLTARPMPLATTP